MAILLKNKEGGSMTDIRKKQSIATIGVRSDANVGSNIKLITSHSHHGARSHLCIALSEGRLCVAEFCNHRVQVF